MRECLYGFFIAVTVISVGFCGHLGADRLSNTQTSLWCITDTTVFTNGKSANPYIEQLIKELEAQDGIGKPVSVNRFKNILQKASSVVYIDKLIKYATPRSLAIQNKDHENFVKYYLQEKWLQNGVEFIQTHNKILQNAEKQYNVASKDIVSILMWESKLGEFSGDYLVFNIYMGQILYLDAARELAVREIIQNGNPDSSTVEKTEKEKRRLERLRKNAVRNLSALIRLAEEKGVDPTIIKGSWGGAIGYVQFMPSSMQFAIDGDGNGNIDLFTWPDAISSAANFLKENGYRSSPKARRRAIHAYNPLNSYVSGVVEYADSLWNQYNRKN